MKRIIYILTATLLVSCLTTRNEAVSTSFPNAVIGSEQSSSTFKYHWLTQNESKQALLVYIPGKGKSGKYKLEVLIDLKGVIRNIKTVGHPGGFGAKVNRSIGSLNGKSLDNAKVDAVSGATISSGNAQTILSRNISKIREVLKIAQ